MRSINQMVLFPMTLNDLVVLTSNPVFKVTTFFDSEYLTDG